MKRIDFIQELFVLTSDYDGDGNGMCGESYEEVVNMTNGAKPVVENGKVIWDLSGQDEERFYFEECVIERIKIWKS